MPNQLGFWAWLALATFVRLVLIWFLRDMNLGFRPEIATPLTSLRRLAEGYWLKQSSMSPYAGSMYHGSPLLLSVLGPLTVKRIEGRPSHLLCSVISVIADVVTALLMRAIGQKLQFADEKSSKLLGLTKETESSYSIAAGNTAAIVYLCNPLTIATCAGFSTTPFENFMLVLSLYGACSRVAPLAAFGWIFSTHFSLYPVILIIPIILLLGFGLDAPPMKLFLQTSNKSKDSNKPRSAVRQFSWKPVAHFLLWACIWSFYILFLCSISLKEYGGLSEMFKSTYGFILTVEDLSPNIGVLWYFFAEVFDFFRVFFLIVFHLNVLLMILPLAIRLNHRPCFLAFVYLTISSMLKSYPSVGDSALYLGLLGLFVNDLKEMNFSFFLLFGYIGVSLLSPVMHNLWIWRGTGNANFYYATAMVYACLQIIVVVESVSTILNRDRTLRKRLNVAE